MKKIITTSTLFVALLTNAQANFEFGDVFKDLNDANNMTINAKTNFEFGDVFKDLNDAHTINTKESTIKVSRTNFEFGDVFKDLKDATQ